MEPNHDRSSSTAASLLRLADLNTAVEAIVELLKTNSPSFESFVVLSDPSEACLRFDSLRSSMNREGVLATWLGAQFEKHPALHQKLLRSELVVLTSADAGTNSQYYREIRAVVLVPVLYEGNLIAAFGLLSQEYDPQVSLLVGFDLDYIGWCAGEAAAPLARMQELESLRKENRRLRQLAQRLAAAEAKVLDLTATNSQLEASAVTRSHLQLNVAAAEARVLDLAAANLQLEASAVMRSHLQSNVAHEMRTPLAAVRGYARMVLDGHAGEINRTQCDYLEVVIENTNKVIDLVNWVTRITENGQRMMLTPLDLRALWGECAASHAEELGASSIRIEEAVPGPQRPFRILADKIKMQRVFHQIIRAAIQFAENGARLILEFSRPRNGGVGVKLSGMMRVMPPNAVEFPFNGSAEGTLADVYDIISLHGGRFFVRRTPEEGLVFLFTLPAVSSNGTAFNASRRSA